MLEMLLMCVFAQLNLTSCLGEVVKIGKGLNFLEPDCLWAAFCATLMYNNAWIAVDVCLCTVQLNKLFTIAVIQPDVIADDKLDLILEKVHYTCDFYVNVM